MFKQIARMTAAALVAAVIAFAITTVPAANDPASNGDEARQERPQPFAKALRVPMKGPACSLQNWPNYQAKCQFDVREAAGEARAVRIIALR
jgi:hypothetical protein